MSASEMTKEDIAAKKRELLRRRLELEGLAGAGNQPLARLDRGGDLPLSFAQQRMWFLQQLEPTSPAYNVSGALVLEGDLDVPALERSFHEIARRHEILRTVYRVDGQGRTAQVILPDARPRLDLVDLRHLGESDRERELAARVERSGRQIFDLGRESPLRPTLLKVDEDRHVLAMALHHIACDDLTWGVLLGELSALYSAQRRGASATLPALPVQYAEFGEWQRQRVTSGALGGDLAYWRERLTPPPPPLNLFADFARPDAPSHAGGRRSRTVSSVTLERLQALGREEKGSTLFMVLLAAFNALLYRHTGLTDVAVGSPAVNRNRAEFEALVGNFGNTLVLRTDLGGDPTFREIVRRVRATCLDAYAHQELPFERLVEELQPNRTINRSPLFDVVFSLRSDPLRNVALPGLSISERPAFNGATRFDLALEATVSPAGLALTFTYRTDLFVPSTIDRLLGHLGVLLEAAAAEPDQKISDLPLVTPSETRTLVHEWNRTATDAELETPVGQRFEAQAAKTPDRVAVVFEGQTLTYEELNRRANRLARRLDELGVGPDTRVGVHLDRSADLIVGLLAILKAGAAFVPLDPTLPAQRLAAMCRDAGLAVALSAPSTTASTLARGVLCVDPSGERLASYDSANLPAAVGASDAAYVIYTSGSTGTPKGVAVPHRGLSNRVLWQASHLGLTADDVVLHKTPLSFDVAVGEIFLPLLVGAKLVVAKAGEHRDPGALLRLIARERVTFAHFVASMLDAFLEQEGLEALGRSLRHVWCGGEALTHNLYVRFRQRFGATLHHGYGPTEASIGVTCRAYEGALGPHERITIGRPIANTQVYLLDANRRPVPVGVAGELYIGGASLALGYLNDDKLTEERWVENPFSDDPSARLYRSGDLARYLPDGNIEFLGRVDHQVKLRGLRIELGEIEAALAQHPGVRQAVVLLRRDRPGAEHLAAYYQASETGAAPGADELRARLQARLPEYMVPRAYARLEQWPLTVSGKIDRQALPSIEVAEPASGARYVEPADQKQQLIAQVWREVLGAERVGAHDNFFDLGGHSLLLVRVHARLQKELGREISLVDLFAHPTVSALASHLGDATAASAELEQARARALRQRQALARRSEVTRRSTGL